MHSRTVEKRTPPAELAIGRSDPADHIGIPAYVGVMLEIWNAVTEIVPFAYLMFDEIRAYIDDATEAGADWQEALDAQVALQVLPELEGTDPRLQRALERIVDVTTDAYPLTQRKAQQMLNAFQQHGFSSYGKYPRT